MVLLHRVEMASLIMSFKTSSWAELHFRTIQLTISAIGVRVFLRRFTKIAAQNKYTMTGNEPWTSQLVDDTIC